MSAPFSQRFKEARMLNGFSLQDLANKLQAEQISISKQALHKYEKGEAIPDTQMLLQLSRVLGVRLDFFFQRHTVELSTPEYRKLSKLPVKEQERITAITRFAVSRYLELESLLDLNTPFINPLANFPEINELAEVEVAANHVRTQWNWGTGPLYNVLELLEDQHVKMILLQSEDSFDGMKAWVNDQQIAVIALNSVRLNSPDRLRFTALHELGHLLLPINHLPEKERERMCNRFAAAMLLPESTAKMEFGAKRNRLHLQELADLKKQYGISMQALAFRANDLGIITDSYLKQFIFMFYQHGWRQTEPALYTGEEKATRFNQLLMRALAEEIISIDKAAVLNNQSLLAFRKQLQMVE